MVAQIISMFPDSTATDDPIFVKRPPVPYEQKVKLARRMRANPTAGEKKMLDMLKGLQKQKPRGGHPILQTPFKHQSIECGYIVDFYIPALHLAIEVDGSSHIGKEDQDAIRDKHLNKGLVMVARFSEHDLMHYRAACKKRLCEIIEDADLYCRLYFRERYKRRLYNLGVRVFDRPKGTRDPKDDKPEVRAYNKLASIVQASRKQGASGLFTKQ